MDIAAVSPEVIFYVLWQTQNSNRYFHVFGVGNFCQNNDVTAQDHWTPGIQYGTYLTCCYYPFGICNASQRRQMWKLTVSPWFELGVPKSMGQTVEMSCLYVARHELRWFRFGSRLLESWCLSITVVIGIGSIGLGDPKSIDVAVGILCLSVIELKIW